MTAVPGDTLQKQIERGEVFYVAGGQLSIGDASPGDTDDTYEYLISTGAKETSLHFSAYSDMNLTVTLHSGVTTSADGIPHVHLNMNFNSAATLDTDVYSVPTITGYGTTKLFSAIPNGVEAPLYPLGLETGVILEPSTKYALVVNNLAQNDTTFFPTMFMREIA